MMKQLAAYFRLTVLFGVIVVALYPLSVNAYPKGEGTITLKDSTVYQDITYEVNRYHKTIEFKINGEKRAVSFTDIAEITDVNGNDITKSVIGGYYRSQDEETWRSEASETYREARRKLWKVSISWGGNYCFPLGDYYEGLRSGFGFDGNIVVPFTHNLAIRATVSYVGIRPEDGLSYLATNDYINFYLLDNFSVSTWKYLLSVQFYNTPNRDKPNLIYYLYSGLGAVSDKIEMDETYLSNDPEDVFTTRVEDSQTEFVTTFGVGMDIMTDETLGFYVGAGLDMLWLGNGDKPNSSYVYDGMQFAFQFDLKVGAVVYLK